MADESVLGTIEIQVAMLIRLGEATRRAPGGGPHRALDRSAYVLLRLLQDGPHNVSTLADRLNLDGSTVTRQVSAMQRDGLVRRRPDPRDGRSIVVEATEAGVAQVEAVRAARRRIYGEVLGDWPEQDRHALATLLERLNAALDGYVRRG